MEEAEENIEEGKAWRQREGRREKAGDQGGREGVKGGGGRGGRSRIQP